VRCIFKENGGPASAQNVGIRSARGEFIGLNGDDDVWLPQKLELQLRLLDEHPEAGLCFSDCLFEGGPWDGESFFELAQFDGDVSVWREARKPSIPAGSVVMRRSSLDRVGLFDESLAVAEDFDLWLRLLADSPAVYVDQALYLYRQHKGPQACDDLEVLRACRIRVLAKNAKRIVASVEGPPAERARIRKEMQRWLRREHTTYRRTQFRKLLQASRCPRRRDLLAVLAASLRLQPLSPKYWRRLFTVLIFGSHLTRWWYCRDNGSFGAAREERDRQKLREGGFFRREDKSTLRAQDSTAP
jgi:glycosyltransferase involved in cell wall biosynthesis